MNDDMTYEEIRQEILKLTEHIELKEMDFTANIGKYSRGEWMLLAEAYNVSYTFRYSAPLPDRGKYITDNLRADMMSALAQDWKAGMMPTFRSFVDEYGFGVSDHGHPADAYEAYESCTKAAKFLQYALDEDVYKLYDLSIQL